MGEGQYRDSNGDIRGEDGDLVKDRLNPLNPINFEDRSSPSDAEMFVVGRHGSMPSPRPNGFQSHHGVNSVWMEANYLRYKATDAPAVLMFNDPNHNATRAVFNQIQAEIANRQGVPIRNIDWSRVSSGTAWRIAEEQFQAARVPQHIVNEYFQQFNNYLDTLR